ncbi:MAG: hypothetical protein WAW37_05795 [Syntrophobacteraceae bacterium]
MQNHTFIGWLVGLFGVSLVAGTFFSWLVWHELRNFFDSTVKRLAWVVPPQANERVPIQPILTGILERLFFTILIAFNVSGVAGGIFTWMVVKMVSGWNRYVGEKEETWRRVLAFNALINNLVSLFFGVIGGLIANGTINIPWTRTGHAIQQSGVSNMTGTEFANCIAIFSGLLAAVCWLWSALVRVPDYVETMANQPGSILWVIRRQSRLSAVAAIFTAISILAQAATAFLKL